MKFHATIELNGKTATGIEVPDDVVLELDTEPREVAVPADLREALDADKVAGAFFDGFSYSQRRRHVLSIEDAKTPETRRRRIDKSVRTLREGRP